MNNLKTYDDYVNEGFYDFMTTYTDNDTETGAGVGAFLGGASQLFHLSAMAMVMKYNNWPLHQGTLGHSIVFIIGLALASSGIVFVSRSVFRNLYHYIRSKSFLRETDQLYRRATQMIEKYPDVEEALNNLQLEMITAIRENNKRNISDCIHKMYTLYKNLQDREKLPTIFKLTDKQKELIAKKKEGLKKIDPYGEEKWEDGNEKKKWWEKPKN